MADAKAGKYCEEEDEGGAAVAGEVMVSDDPRAQQILRGFKVRSMKMTDAVTGTLKWESADWSEDMYTSETKANLPKDILECRAVSREIEFSSDALMEEFRLEQRVLLEGACIEEWHFRFGFVIPGSTNTWQHTIQAADESHMLPAELLSGKLVIETSFFDGDLLVCKTCVRIYYV